VRAQRAADQELSPVIVCGACRCRRRSRQMHLEQPDLVGRGRVGERCSQAENFVGAQVALRQRARACELRCLIIRCEVDHRATNRHGRSFLMRSQTLDPQTGLPSLNVTTSRLLHHAQRLSQRLGALALLRSSVVPEVSAHCVKRSCPRLSTMRAVDGAAPYWRQRGATSQDPPSTCARAAFPTEGNATGATMLGNVHLRSIADFSRAQSRCHRSNRNPGNRNDRPQPCGALPCHGIPRRHRRKRR